ncbi:N-acetylmuramoyl-L-alanine amidase [uncultured Bacteroides sp.]|uniref:N-acetylmuramoyl-L-alanine amidase n=1 Tax=uncultured Bacteroides sp. TaxID=162156 RepID=UPI002AA85A20|nr:N-acetylmuramoyl-L-alanine amidase [uncultured Bacteroides sp.]
MREINLIVIHCSATRSDRNITAQDINAAHKVRGFSSWGYHYYIRKNGKVEPMRSVDEVGAHARGYNAKSIGVCYEGGLDTNGKPADTRTLSQQIALHALVSNLLKEHSGCKVVGHRDLSPDKNYNGIIDPWERVKECPCFSVLDESWE